MQCSQNSNIEYDMYVPSYSVDFLNNELRIVQDSSFHCGDNSFLLKPILKRLLILVSAWIQTSL